jgi:hypothetical protein
MASHFLFEFRPNLISLYVPEILSTFGLSNGQFGALYALCTIAASAIMLRCSC